MVNERLLLARRELDEAEAIKPAVASQYSKTPKLAIKKRLQETRSSSLDNASRLEIALDVSRQCKPLDVE